MAINFKTAHPQALLDAFRKAIRDGKVVTWTIDVRNDYFTHSTDQWRNLAWFMPKVNTTDGSLDFYIIKPQGKNISVEVYAIYHGRFIESLLAHCDGLFSSASATSLPEKQDRVQ